MSFSLLCSVYADLLAVTANTLKLYSTINGSKQGIIRTDAYACARMNVSTSLANQDVASLNELTVCTLYAQTLGLRITAVLGRTRTLLMCKNCTLIFSMTYTSMCVT